MLNLKKLEVKLDEALTGETTESLTEWMNEKVMEQINHNRLIKLEQLAALLQSVWHYGEFKAETLNEREMEIIMGELGYWPVTMSATTWELNLNPNQLNKEVNNMEDWLINWTGFILSNTHVEYKGLTIKDGAEWYKYMFETWSQNSTLGKQYMGEMNNMGRNNNPDNNTMNGETTSPWTEQINEHLIIRETVGYEFMNNVALEDIPAVMKMLTMVYNYVKMGQYKV